MATRPVHLLGEDGRTACCGKALGLLGQGPRLTTELEGVTCPQFEQVEISWRDPEPRTDDGMTAFRQAVDEGVRQIAAATQVREVHVHQEGEDCNESCILLTDTGPLKLRPGDQQLPVPNDEPDIQSQVIADIEARRQVGIQRYGTALQAGNGRNAVRDLYEELLDGAMYAKQWLVERERLLDRIAVLEDEIAQERALRDELVGETFPL